MRRRVVGVCGGEEGIRTLETVPRLHAFQACAFDHSATSPLEGAIYSGRGGNGKLCLLGNNTPAGG
jgi:hypothetical protein